ncbi:MAG: hypothetical protein M9916_03140 [Crocinitomicaceae bacterium]|nr:hypothetical protein [Crocinitomicaceae bacterium]
MNVFDYYIKAFESLKFYLSKGKIWLFIIPSFFVFVVYGMLFLLLALLLSPLGLLAYIPFIGDYLQSFYDWTLVTSNSILFYARSFTILTLLSPFMNLLSSKCDELYHKKSFEYSIGLFFADLWRAFKVNFILFSMYLVVVTIISLLIQPILGATIGKGLSYIASSMLFGFSFFDYNFERYRMGISSTFEKGFKNWMVIFIGGVIFQFIYLLPILGIVFAPFLTTILTTDVFIKNKSMWND